MKPSLDFADEKPTEIHKNESSDALHYIIH